MLPFSLYLHLGFGFISGVLSATLGLVLVNIFPQPKKIMLTGLCYVVALALLKSMYLPFGIPFAILTMFLVMIVMLIWKLTIIRAALVTIIGTSILLLLEAIFSPLMVTYMKTTFVDIVSQSYLAIFLPLPQIFLAIAIILLCLRFNLYIFDFRVRGVGEFTRLNGKRLGVLLGLLFSLLLLIGMQIVCNVTIFSIQADGIFNTLPITTIGHIANVSVASLFIIIIILATQFIELTDKESQLILQSTYLDSIEELHTALSAQKHDLANDWQVLYGLMQLEEMEEAKKYLEQLIGKTLSSEKFIDTGNPALSALLYIKSGVALAEGIKFDVSVEAFLDQKHISTYELNRLIGNLINNAFDAVAGLEESKRLVQLRIFDDGCKQVLEIANFGKLEDEVKGRLFKKGFSTKAGNHSGLGLYIVKKIVEQHNAMIKTANRGDMVIFNISFPKAH